MTAENTAMAAPNLGPLVWEDGKARGVGGYYRKYFAETHGHAAWFFHEAGKFNEAGNYEFHIGSEDGVIYACHIHHAHQVALWHAAQAAEREACAKELRDLLDTVVARDIGFEVIAGALVDAIRARSEAQG